MVYFMQNYSDEKIINLGPGYDVPIRELVTLVCEVVGYEGGLRFDTSRPDGTPRKLVDTAFAESLGWRAKTPLKQGLEETYRWFVDNVGAEQRRVNVLGPGDYFGELALLNGGSRTATVRATQPTEVYGLDRADFLALLRDNPEIAAAVEAVKAKRQPAILA